MLNTMPRRLPDQAESLRTIPESGPGPVKVMAVTSGKGGVGKSNVSANLAVMLARSGKRVMLMDADLGLANVDALLGIHTRYNLSHVISGQCDLADVISDGPAGVKVIPAASGKRGLTQLVTSQYGGLIQAFSDLSHEVDILIIDTAAGISQSTISFSRAAQEVIVVVCDEPSSVTDAYAQIKVLHKHHGISNFHIISNRTSSAHQARELYLKLCNVAQQHLSVNLSFMGAIPDDEYLRKAVKRQQSVVEAFPRSKSARAFKHLAKRVSEWPAPTVASGKMEFFVERFFRQGYAMVGDLL